MGEDPRKEFQSYLFFLRHFRQLIWAERADPGELNRLILRIVEDQNPLIAHLPPKDLTDQDRTAIRKLVFAAWNSEGVARLSRLFGPDVRKFTNQWKPVHCYYAIYFLLVSVHFVAREKIPYKHEPTLRYATDSILHWFPVPWNLRIDYDQKALHNFPDGISMWADSGWNLRNNEPYLHTANFFRRTAQRKQRELWREKYKPKKLRIPAGPRAGRRYRIADVPIGSISIFDVLWRFRRWANYQEADTIIEGQEYELHTMEFDEAFDELVESIAALLENVLRRYLGVDILHRLYQDFLALAERTLDCASIRRRRDVICEFVPF